MLNSAPSQSVFSRPVVNNPVPIMPKISEAEFLSVLELRHGQLSYQQIEYALDCYYAPRFEPPKNRRG